MISVYCFSSYIRNIFLKKKKNMLVNTILFHVKLHSQNFCSITNMLSRCAI